MEKKTLGSFLSVLRKAKGMTQKELAELLNVSDKAVSRWERDESMPDILLIPVLADIFEVSCDELLKGERTIFPKTLCSMSCRIPWFLPGRSIRSMRAGWSFTVPWPVLWP